MRKLRRIAQLLLLAGCAALLTAQDNSPYDALILECNALARDGKYLEAFAKAREAIQANPSRFEAYYYAAFALYNRDMLSDAKMAAADALSRAPADRKPEVQKLVSIIEQREKVQEQVKVAEQAARDGLGGRAAEAYTAAWRLDDTRDDIGLAAAKQWLQVQDYASAARILNEIHDHPHDGPSAAEANQILAASGNEFMAEYNKRGCGRFSRAVSGRTDIPVVENCAALSPTDPGPIFTLAFVYLGQNDYPNAEAWLLKASRIHKLTIAEVLKRTTVPKGPLKDERFLKFLRDALGPAAVDEAQNFSRSVDSALAATDPVVRMRLLNFLNVRYSNASVASLIANERSEQLPATLEQLKSLLPVKFEHQLHESSGELINDQRLERVVDSIEGCNVAFHQDEIDMRFVRRLDSINAIRSKKSKRDGPTTTGARRDSETGLPAYIERETVSFSLSGASATFSAPIKIAGFFDTPEMSTVSLSWREGSSREGSSEPHNYSQMKFVDQDQAQRVAALINEAAAACGRPVRGPRR